MTKQIIQDTLRLLSQALVLIILVFSLQDTGLSLRYSISSFLILSLLSYIFYKILRLRSWLLLGLTIFIVPALVNLVLASMSIGNLEGSLILLAQFAQQNLLLFTILIPFLLFNILHFNKSLAWLEVLVLLLASSIILTNNSWEDFSQKHNNYYSLIWLCLPSLLLLQLYLGLENKPNSNYKLEQLSYNSLYPNKTLGRKLLKPLRLIIAVLLILLLLFLLSTWLERNNEQYQSGSGSGLLEQGLSNFDFSDYLRLESEIKMNQQLVMIVKQEGPASFYLLRRMVLGAYSKEKGFYNAKNPPRLDSELSIPLYAPTGAVEFKHSDEHRLRQLKEQTYYLININPAAFFSLNYPLRIQSYTNWEESSFSRVYSVEANWLANTSLAVSLEELGNKPVNYENLPRAWYQYYTDFAADLRIQELALEITKNKRSPLAKAQAIEDYFHSKYYYSLKPGLSRESNQLYHFLFESQRGYCSYFAFAMTLMLRSLGIPSRVVVGFQVLDENRILDYYPLYGEQAHSWVEVYNEDYAWVEFDPTSSRLSPNEDFNFGNHDLEDLSSLTQEILNNQDLHSSAAATNEIFTQNWRTELFDLLKNTSIRLLFIIPLFYLLVNILYLLFLHAKTKDSKQPARKQIYYIYRYATLKFRNYTIDRSKFTITEYGETLYRQDNIDISLLLKNYLQSLYDRNFENTDLDQVLRKIRLELKKRRKSWTRSILELLWPWT